MYDVSHQLQLIFDEFRLIIDYAEQVEEIRLDRVEMKQSIFTSEEQTYPSLAKSLNEWLYAILGGDR